MDMFSDFFLPKGIQVNKLSNDSYFVKLSCPKTEPIVKVIIEVKYNKVENSLVERTGIDKVSGITKNMKGTNISDWQQNVYIFENVQYFNLKYSDFKFIDNIIRGEKAI